MTKVGVILSGCGFLDGSEIYEAVLTLLALDRAGVTIVAMAPDVEAALVVNHYNGEETRGETARSVLAESARLVRGKITSINEISVHDIDALILVGGFGAARNLSTFANDGVGATINPGVERLISETVGLGKPLGAMCIATTLVALALRGRENATAPILTIGDDLKTLTTLEAWGARHQVTSVDQICIDEQNRIVTTPAFMLADGPAEAETGINKLVEQVVGMARAMNTTYRGDAVSA